MYYHIQWIDRVGSYDCIHDTYEEDPDVVSVVFKGLFNAQSIVMCKVFRNDDLVRIFDRRAAL